MRTRYSWTLRIISAVTLAFFSWTFLSLWQIPAAWAAEKQKSSAKGQSAGRPVSREQRPEEKFEGVLETMRENVSKAGKKADRGEDDSAEREAIRGEKTEIEKIDLELRKEFAGTEQRLKTAKLPKEILARHTAFVEHYTSNISSLKKEIDDIDNAKITSDRKAKLETARLHLEKTKKPSTHKKLDPNNLPFRARKAAKTRAPRLKREDFERDFPKQHKAGKMAGLQVIFAGNEHEWARAKNKPIQLAFNGPDSDIPLSLGAQTVSPQVAFADASPIILAQQSSDLPTPDDLAENGIEIQFTPEIRGLAANLGGNSLRIFEAIRNNFRFEPYYGSLKGVQQTLREKAGNDYDLASLLISCYRAAGIPARYVVATISMPLSQAQNWLGLDDPRLVGRLFASAGVPVAVDYTAGIIRLEHVLVQAWVPYQNGRGALNGPGDTWVYMDPSYKETKITQLLDQAIPAFDQTQYLSQLRAEDPSEYYSGLVQENLNTTAPGRTVYAVARHREIVPLNLGMLTGMPQYDIVTIGGSFQEIPDQFRYKITFELTDLELLGTSLTYQASTVELAGKRITLSYSPATADDQAIIGNYGDIYSTPCYLVKLKPELRLEGSTIATGLPIGSGSAQPFTMRFISPTGESEQVANNAVAGAYYAIAIDLQTITPNMVFERTQKLQAMNDFITAGGTATLDDHAGELLYATALTYFQKLDAANRTAQELLKFTDLRGVSEAIFSIDVQTAYVFGVPKSVDVSGVHIDVDRDMHLPIPVDGNTAKIKEYNLLVGSNSSYFEHKIIEDIYPTEAISAVKGLQLASAQGIQVQTINGDNINAILPTLQVRQEIQTDIANAVNAGKEVIVPQQEISLNAWRGSGFIVMNPQTGEAGYMISGGFAGGDSTLPLTTYIKATALSQNVAVEKELAAIENSIERDYIIFPGPDNSITSPEALRLYAVDEYKVTQPITGPPNTKCAGMFSDAYYAPDYDLKAPLLDINGSLANNLTKNITVYDFVGMSGSSSYGRISSGFIQTLDYYIQSLMDLGMDPTISSGYRTWLHNCTLPKAVINSNHIDGIAADVDVVSTKNQAIAAQLAMKMIRPVGGVGYKIYNTIVHVDLGKPRDW